MQKITPEYIESIRNNQKVRQRLAFEHPLWFSLLYLRHHFTQPFAPFHSELFRIVEYDEYELVVVMAFRGSGKSTVMNMATVLWSILGKPGKKFTIIMSKTQEQAKNHFANIKAELETNDLLREDFGPFSERPEEWHKLSLDLVYHEAKILSVARDQSIRGLRHGPHRPDLIICDDLEDSGDGDHGQPVYEQFAREVLPSGGPETRIIVLGNLLHKESFMMRLRSDAQQRSRAIFRAYPLVDAYDRCLWPGKYPDAKALARFRNTIPSATWTREYELDAVSDAYYHEHRNETEDEPHIVARLHSLNRRMVKARNTYRHALEKAGKVHYQEALVKPMRKFAIEAPFPTQLMDAMTFHSEKVDDPPYLRQYRSEMKLLVDELLDVYDERRTGNERMRK